MPTSTTLLRALPALPTGNQLQTLINNRRVFELQRGSSATSPEIEWLINGKPFDEHTPLAKVKQGSWEAWEIRNGGGGWVHPMHIHQEEHQVIMRNGKSTPDARHPDDRSREDVVALDPSESVIFLRRFRTFPAGPNATSSAKYVAHCHNLAHEDHAMMFGWEIIT